MILFALVSTLLQTLPLFCWCGRVKTILVHEFGPPEVMQLEEVEDLRPRANQVVVRVKAAGVNPMDTYVRSGGYATMPSLPYTPGIEAAGIVEKVGEDVKNVSVGTRVYTSGIFSLSSYAEQIVCEVGDVHLLPGHLSFSDGAAVGVAYATAYRALFQRGHAAPGETVLIHGASGGVGIAAIQLSRASGMQVIASAGTEKGRKLILDQGAPHVLDHTVSGHLDQVLELTAGQGADIILKMLANVNLGFDLRALAKGGRALIVGSRGKVDIDPRDTMTREATILGVYLFNMANREKAIAYSALGAGLENRSLHPVVGKEFPLTEAPRSHREVMQPGAYGKIVLIP